MVVAAWLTVEAIIRDDPQAESKREFKQVQAAKLVDRLASGTHKRWSAGAGGATEMHVYPASRGPVLSLVGTDLEGLWNWSWSLRWNWSWSLRCQ